MRPPSAVTDVRAHRTDDRRHFPRSAAAADSGRPEPARDTAGRTLGVARAVPLADVAATARAPGSAASFRETVPGLDYRPVLCECATDSEHAP